MTAFGMNELVRFGSTFPFIADADSGPLNSDNYRFGIHARYRSHSGLNFADLHRHESSQVRKFFGFSTGSKSGRYSFVPGVSGTSSPLKSTNG